MTAVIYARYSSDNQREESIEGQIRECTAYAEKNDITIVKHYIDRAISAKTDNRPQFQQMIKDSDKKLFDIVLVWKLDRFARNRYDSAGTGYVYQRRQRAGEPAGSAEQQRTGCPAAVQQQALGLLHSAAAEGRSIQQRLCAGLQRVSGLSEPAGHPARLLLRAGTAAGSTPPAGVQQCDDRAGCAGRCGADRSQRHHGRWLHAERPAEYRLQHLLRQPSVRGKPCGHSVEPAAAGASVSGQPEPAALRERDERAGVSGQTQPAEIQQRCHKPEAEHRTGRVEPEKVQCSAESKPRWQHGGRQ